MLGSSPPALSGVWWLADWQPHPLGLGLAAAVAAPYAVLLARARRAGVSWPLWRVVCFALLGIGTLLYAVCGPLGVHRTSAFWVATLQVGVLSAVTPAGLAVGDPVGLAHAVAPGGRARALDRFVHSWPVRVLTFPLVASALAVGTLIAVFFTGYFDASTRSPLVESVLVVHVTLTGLVFVLPLLTDDVLPGWATPPVRAIVAFGDGLLDAIPGIMLMVSTTLLAPDYPGFAGQSPADALWQQRWGGGTLLAVTEAVGVPVLAAVFVDWMRSDEREARETDARLDAAACTEEETNAGDGSNPEERSRATDRGAGAGRLWWEDDPRFAERIYRRR